jgi:uncharacterized membrane protein YqjE
MSSPSGGGLFDSLHRLVDTAVEILQVRLQLLGSELEQEKLRLIEAMVQAAIGLVMVALSLVLALGFVVLLFWEGYRLPAIGVLTLLFAGGGAWLLRTALNKARGPEGGPFALSLSELRRDREGLRREPPEA